MSARELFEYAAIALAFAPIAYLLWPSSKSVRIRIEEAKEHGLIAEWDVLKVVAVNRTAPVDVAAFHLLWQGGRLDEVEHVDEVVRLEDHEPVYFTVTCARLARLLRERGLSGTVAVLAELEDTRGRKHRSRLFSFDVDRAWVDGGDAS